MSLFRNLLRTDKRCLLAFLKFGLTGARTFRQFDRRRRNGSAFPAFQFISVTNRCNLACQGCWISQNSGTRDMSLELADRIIRDSNDRGSWFFGILGGEPLLYPDLVTIFRRHPRSYFQLFTNGTLLTDRVAAELRSCANVTPLISFEGNETVADIRRGGTGVYRHALRGIENAVGNGLITGVAISVCQSNLEMALSHEFVQMMHQRGVLYLWYYLYRPVGEQPCYELALTEEQIRQLRVFLVEGRKKFPVILIDSYWDADGNPFCPAAEGLSHHINPWGHIEPCPVIQYSCGQVGAENLGQTYDTSRFLQDLKEGIHHRTRGCILMEEPRWLAELAGRHQALNTSGRPAMEEQLRTAPAVCSHASCPVIPESRWIYRFAKRNAFFGLGSYG